MDTSYIQISDDEEEKVAHQPSSFVQSSQSPTGVNKGVDLKRSLDLYMSNNGSERPGTKAKKKPHSLLQTSSSVPRPVNIVSYFIKSNNTTIQEEDKDNNLAVTDTTCTTATVKPPIIIQNAVQDSVQMNHAPLMFKPPKLIKAPIATTLKPLPFDDEMDYNNGLVNHGKIQIKAVPRYGKIYKRKAQGNLGYKCLQPVEGYRFCKFCNANLPLTAFYATTKRYVCRRHHYLRVVKNIYDRAKKDDCFYLACHAKRKLACFKYQLGYDKIKYDVSDIAKILNHLSKLIPIKQLHPVCVPIDYTLQLCAKDNIAVISCRAFTLLMRLHEFVPYKALYIAYVQRMNLIPLNFDTQYLKDPYHDPEYRRKQIDVSALFSSEFTSDPIIGNSKDIASLFFNKESQDHDIVEEFQKHKNVPWLTEKSISAGQAGLWVDGKPVSNDADKNKWWEIRSKKRKVHKKADGNNSSSSSGGGSNKEDEDSEEKQAYLDEVDEFSSGDAADLL